MKSFKQFDFYLQLLLIPAGVLFCFMLEGPDFVIPYFVVGIWQILSCVVHEISSGYYRVRDRKLYRITLVITILLFPLSITGFMIEYLMALLIVSPFFAVWYLTICYRENRIIENKELSQLK